MQQNSKIITDLLEEFKLSLQTKVGYNYVVSIKRKPSVPEWLTFKEIEDILNEYIPKRLQKEYPTIREKGRNKVIIDLRFIFFHIARSLGYHLIPIGNYFKKDHSTVINGLKKFEDYASTDHLFEELYNEILLNINTTYGKNILHHPVKKSINPESALSTILL